MLALKIVPGHRGIPDTRNVLDFALRQTRKKSRSLKPRPVANVRQGTRKPDGRSAQFSEAGRAKIVAHTFRERTTLCHECSHAIQHAPLWRARGLKIPVKGRSHSRVGGSPDGMAGTHMSGGF